MRASIQILSKKLREQWVEVLASEGDENSEVVRLKFRELPDTEFDALDAQYRGRLLAFSKVIKKTNELEEELKLSLPPGEKGKALTLAQSQQLSEFKGSLEAMREIRREVVSKVVIDHNPEDFELTDLPMPGEDLDLWEEAKKALAEEYGFTEEELAAAVTAGYLPFTFRGATWEYETKGQIKQMAGAHPDTVRFYEKIKPSAALLNSICNAVFYWHRLNLKNAKEQKAALREARLIYMQQGMRIDTLVKAGVFTPERGAILKGLSPDTFEIVLSMFIETTQSLTERTEKVMANLAAKAPASPTKG